MNNIKKNIAYLAKWIEEQETRRQKELTPQDVIFIDFEREVAKWLKQ